MPVTLQPTNLKYKTQNGTFQSATCLKGDSYTLTTADKAEIAQQAAEEVNVPVQDVQVNGTSIVSGGVANVSVASTTDYGVLKVGGIATGLSLDPSGYLKTSNAYESEIKIGTNLYRPIVPATQHAATFYGLAKVAGDSTQSASNNAVGVYTEEAKNKILTMIGAEKAQPKYELIENIIIGYSVLASQPEDWAENWTAYYQNTGTLRDPIYTALAGDSAPEWAEGTYYSYSADGVTGFKRTMEPNGTFYDFDDVLCVYSYAHSSSIRVTTRFDAERNSDYHWVGRSWQDAQTIAVCYIHCFWNGVLWETIRNYGGTTAYMGQGTTPYIGNLELPQNNSYTQFDPDHINSIKAITVISSSIIPSGMSYRIYAKRKVNV